MNDETQTPLAPGLRAELPRRRADLRAEVQASETARRDGRGRETGDFKDDAAWAQQAESAEAEEQRDLDELADVEAALRRLDAGTYGSCVDCGEALDAARLLARRSAGRCLRCQQACEGAPRSRARPV